MAAKLPKDPRGGHIRLYWDLFDSNAWNGLTATDQRTYLALRRQLGKANNGDLSLPLSRSRHYGIKSPTTLAKSLRALVAVGLIAVTRRGGCTRGGQRLPTLYRFTCEETYAFPAKLIDRMPATNEWKEFKTKDEAAAVIRKAEKVWRSEVEKKSQLQKLTLTSSPAVAVSPITSPELEGWQTGPIREVKRVGTEWQKTK